MRRLRSVVLGGLAALLLAASAAAAPGAGAEVDGIAWDVPAGSFSVDQPLEVCATDGGAFEPGQQVRVDVMLGGSWVEKETVTAAALDPCVFVDTWAVLPGPGSWFLRARTEDALGVPLSVNTAVTVTGTNSMRLGMINGVPGGDLYLYTTAADKAVTVDVSAWGQSVDLQRKSGSSWLHVGRVTVPMTGLSAVARFRLPTKAGDVTYRLVNRASPWLGSEISHSFVVHQTDFEKHRNYLVKARQHVATYCPRTPIYVDTRLVRGHFSGWAETTPLFESGTGRPGITSRIELPSGLTATGLRNQAVHQCARVVQGRWVVEDRTAEETAKAAYAFKNSATGGPVLAQSVCMVAPAARRIFDGYIFWGCFSSTQAASAQRMWSHYGTRYQSVPYFYDAP